MSDEVSRKIGRPRQVPSRLKKCPRCGKLGYLTEQVQIHNTKDGPKRYVYKRFVHYSRRKFKEKGDGMTQCTITKKSSGKEHD